MVLDRASRNLAIEAKRGRAGTTCPSFFMVRLNELAEGAFVGQTDMDETLPNLE